VQVDVDQRPPGDPPAHVGAPAVVVAARHELVVDRLEVAGDVGRQTIGKGYPVFSWYCIMSGMGIFPDAHTLRAPTPSEARYKMSEIDNLLQRSALNFVKQRDLLADIPPKRREDALQIYFW